MNKNLSNLKMSPFHFRYSRDIDDLSELMARSKSRISIGSVIEDFYPQNSKTKLGETESTHVLI